MIFDFKIIFHPKNKKTKTVCDIIFMANEIAVIKEDLNAIFKNKKSKNTDTPCFSVALNLWAKYPENIDFSKGKEVNSNSLSNEYKELIYTNIITEDDFSHVALTQLFDFIINKIKTMDFQLFTFVKELLVKK